MTAETGQTQPRVDAASTARSSEDLFDDLPLGETTFSAHPYGDQIGRLFRCRGELYRAIKTEHSAFYRRLFDEKILSQLIKRGLFVETTPTSHRLTDCDLVVRHASIPSLNFPTEWCPPMFRDAAVATLDVQLSLLEHHATLIDAHPWNVVFDATRPVLVDLTAISSDPMDGSWPDEATFRRYFTLPLRAMTRGRFGLGRLLVDTSEIRDTDLVNMLPTVIPARLRARIRRLGIGGAAQRSERLKQRLRRWREQLAGISFACAPCAETDDAAFPLAKKLKSLGSATVLTVDAGVGVWPTILAKQGLRVVACDGNVADCTSLYSRAKDQNLCVLPLNISVLEATSTFGTFRRKSTPTTDRLRYDAVVAREPVGALASPQDWMYLDQVIEALAALANQWVAVRLAGVTDETALDKIFARHFASVELIDSSSRWYLCRCAPRPEGGSE